MVANSDQAKLALDRATKRKLARSSRFQVETVT